MRETELNTKLDQEESGVRPALGSLKPRGRLVFVRPTASTISVTDIALFVVEAWEGEPRE